LPIWTSYAINLVKLIKTSETVEEGLIATTGEFRHPIKIPVVRKCLELRSASGEEEDELGHQALRNG
jgi:hypothetical protein